ncbi:unnamed protein product, partial [Phaeothamnion confervicola]
GITLNAGGGIGIGAAVNTDVSAGGKIYLTTNGVGAAGNETLIEAGPITFGPAGNNTGAAVDFGTGTLRAVSAGAITQSVGSAITGTALGARAVNTIDMNQPNNDFVTVAAAVSGLNQSVTYKDVNGFTLGTVGASTGFASTSGITTNNGNVTLTAG